MKQLFIYGLLILSSFSLVAQQDLSSMKGSKINATANFKFGTASYYNYKINSSDLKDSVYKKVSNSQVPEEMLTQKFNSIFTNKGKIIVYAKFTCEYNQLKYCIIKYRKVENNIPGKLDYFVTEFKSQSWYVSNTNNEVINNFKTILSINDDLYTYFEVKDEDVKFQEFATIRSQSKDADGTLNIRLLAQNITNNPSLFAKYIDK